MSRYRAYIQPFDTNGNYTGTWLDVSDDMDFDSMGKISRKVDANDYDVGVYKFANFSISLFNSSGKYSAPSVFQSLFKFKVANTLFKLTWDANDYYCRAGTAVAGDSILFQEIEFFRGIISDTAGAMDISTQKVTFNVLGYESVFDQVINPGTLLNTDIFSALIYKVLNQTAITDLITVDPGNITLGIDGYTVDDVTQYDGATVKTILDNLLFLSNSVLYVKSDVLYVVSRNMPGSSLFTFRGQASNEGIENIVKIDNLNSGTNKMFNYWTWEQTNSPGVNTEVGVDVDSIESNGYSAKDVSGYPEISPSNTTLIQILLDAYAAQFKDLRQEFEVTIPVKADKIGIFLMDHVSVDYPTVFIPADSNQLPLYGIAIYGAARYPLGQWQLTIPSTDDYQITGWSVDVKNQNYIFQVKRFN